jgi:hypothetical protein
MLNIISHQGLADQNHTDPALAKQRQDNCEFEVSLSYIVIPLSRQNKTKQNKTDNNISLHTH